MPSPIPSLLSLCLIGSGTALALLAGRPLVLDPELNPPLNPLGINGSPYGEVFAMAMQGPIDTYFHIGMDGVGHQHGPGSDHNHSEGEGRHEPNSGLRTKPTPPSVFSNLGKHFGNFLTSLGGVHQNRTNTYAATEAHKRHIRRKAEDKLRFANRLDPAHYGNYVGLHFFLIEPEMGSRPKLTPAIEKLANDTIEYCLKDRNDPRPALTAAAAASHMIHMMFADAKTPNPHYNVKHMRHYMTVLDNCILQYHNISREWGNSKNWDQISPARIRECHERLYFIGKIRDAAEQTIVRLENKPPSLTAH